MKQSSIKAATVAALIVVCLVPPNIADAGRFSALIADAALSTKPGGPAPRPPVPPPSAKCENCDGVGKVGDGTIMRTCPVCNGTGKATTTEPTDADSQSTPWPAVGSVLNALAPKPDEVLLDPGCGHDARLLIQACRYFGTKKAIGVEINPELAESARQHVAQAGLSDQIEIITGDSTKLDLEADIGVAYMWPEVLTELKPKIQQLDRFVAYGFAVPDLQMTPKTAANGGKLYVWNAVMRVPITKTSTKIARLPRGSYCQVCGGHCSNPMAHVREQQIVGYVDKDVRETSGTNAQPRGHWETRQVCNGRQCKNVRVFVLDR